MRVVDKFVVARHSWARFTGARRHKEVSMNSIPVPLGVKAEEAEAAIRARILEQVGPREQRQVEYLYSTVREYERWSDSIPNFVAYLMGIVALFSTALLPAGSSQALVAFTSQLTGAQGRFSGLITAVAFVIVGVAAFWLMRWIVRRMTARRTEMLHLSVARFVSVPSAAPLLETILRHDPAMTASLARMGCLP